MAGSGLIAIKRRIKSITNTKKITKAMGLVATAKLRKTRVILEQNDKFFLLLKETINKITECVEDYNIYTHGNKSNQKLFIVFTSESGLCGGFNGSAVSELVNQASIDKENSKVLVVGQKGRVYFKKLKYETVAEYVGISDLPTLKEARVIAERALKLYEKEEVGEVNVTYTKFYSAVKQEVKTVKLLPLENANKTAYSTIIFEPNVDELLVDTIDTYIQSCILNYMINSKASEHGARMSAMEGSTKSANELIDKLELKYNRLRQSAITQEISEIVGGAEAQK